MAEEVTIYHPDEAARNRLFKEHKEDGWHMVHRLRDWEPNQILWGYEMHRDGGMRSGKTFTREGITGRAGLPDDDETPAAVNSGHEDAREAYEDSIGFADPPAAFFFYGARIERVRQEPPGADPGEPPLKEAKLRNVFVVDSTVICDE